MGAAHCVLLLLLLLHCSREARGQTPAAAPAPAGPPNVTAVLEKAGQFTTLIRLMRSTQVGDQINTQLNNSNAGITLFAPTDNAFSSLPPGTLNSLSDQQKVALVQFHVLPSFLPLSQFQTVTNPVRTQAGDAAGGAGFPLNVTSSGNQVNITTGVVNTTISNTLFSGGQLAVYQLDQVLLPMQLFGTPAPAPAPAAVAPKKGSRAASADGPSGSSKDAAGDSAAGRVGEGAAGRVAAAALLGFFFFFWWEL
uniref:Fasciclin-like arabinogalactan protein 11 n=1 Tax=Anthurium amnicola TaxID=1678845 RepID=A0A1D1ZKK1_9ARAE